MDGIILLVAEDGVEVEDGLLLLLGELAPLDVRPQSEEVWSWGLKNCTCKPGQCPPAAMAILLDVVEQLLILLRCPWPLLEATLIAARNYGTVYEQSYAGEISVGAFKVDASISWDKEPDFEKNPVVDFRRKRID
uniref:Uncharacterized protein n=1 Tax=Oryza nivara TaxID=4536 RepID=A0A0E0IDK5_ORYNI